MGFPLAFLASIAFHLPLSSKPQSIANSLPTMYDVAQRQKNDRRTAVNFGVVGTNFITDQFLHAAKENPAFTLTAVYSRTEDRAKEYARMHGAARPYWNFEAFCASPDIDAVYVASPNARHFEQTIALLKHKKHVLCEKPIATNALELQAMLDQAAASGRVVAEAIRPLYSPHLRILKEKAAQISPIRLANIQFCQYSSRYDMFKQGLPTNTFDPSLSNGALMDLGVYCVYLAVLLFGEPSDIQASAITLPNGIDIAGCAHFVYPGFIACVQYSKSSQGYVKSEIQGEKGSILFDRPSVIKGIEIASKEERIVLPDLFAEWMDMRYEIEAFLQFIKADGGAGQYGTVSEANQSSLAVMRTLDKIRAQCGIHFAADSSFHIATPKTTPKERES